MTFPVSRYKNCAMALSFSIILTNTFTERDGDGINIAFCIKDGVFNPKRLEAYAKLTERN